jgi:hypothetical protein
MLLGAFTGGAVRLGGGPGPVVIGDGIETVLSAMQLWGLPGWAALCAHGVESLCIDGLPDEIVIASDNDRKGRRAASNLRQRLAARGKRSRVLIPSGGLNDFNDVLRAIVIKGAG